MGLRFLSVTANVITLPSRPPGDLIYPSSNELEIPDIVLEHQDSVDVPLVAWGSRSRRGEFRGTWHFYVDDYRFSQIWERPERLCATGALGAVEPNFSVYEQTPFPVALWATYRKRWLARFWQSRGLSVWVDLNVSEAHSEINLIGVPRGWKWFATRGYDERIEDLRREHALAVMHAEATPILLVYGGGKTVAECVRELGGAIHFPETTGPRHFPKRNEWQKDQAARAARTA